MSGSTFSYAVAARRCSSPTAANTGTFRRYLLASVRACGSRVRRLSLSAPALRNFRCERNFLRKRKVWRICRRSYFCFCGPRAKAKQRMELQGGGGGSAGNPPAAPPSLAEVSSRERASLAGISNGDRGLTLLHVYFV